MQVSTSRLRPAPTPVWRRAIALAAFFFLASGGAQADQWNLSVVIGDSSTPPDGVEMTYSAYCYYRLPAPAAPGPDWGYDPWIPGQGLVTWWRKCGQNLPIGAQVQIEVEASPIGIRAVPTPSPGAGQYYFFRQEPTGCYWDPVCLNETEIRLEAKAGSVEGFVRFTGTPTPIEGITVAAYVGNYLSSTASRVTTTVTNAQGHYEFQKPQPTQWDVQNHWALGVDAWVRTDSGRNFYEYDYYVLAFPIGDEPPLQISTVATSTTTVFPSQTSRKDFVFANPEGDEHDPNDSTEEEEDPEGRPPHCPAADPCCKPEDKVGKPVSVITGAASLDQVDTVIRGIRRTLEFSRRYNSRRAFHGLTGIFGRGWQHALEKSITPLTQGLLRLETGTGGPIYFRDPEGDGTFDAWLPVTERSRVVASAAGYSRIFSTGGTETYASTGRLVAQTDRVGNVTALSRDASGRLTSITLPGGRALTFDYEGNRVIQLRGPAGALATYSYSPEGFLVRVEYPSGSGYTYTYDGAGQLLTVSDLSGRVIETHAYSGGRAITSEIAAGQERFTLSYGGGTTSVADATGGVRAYQWTRVAGIGRVQSVTQGCSSCGARAGDWSYDSRGRQTQRSWVDPQGVRQVVTYTYDADDNFATVSLPLGRTTTYTYDSEGRILTRLGPDGATSSWTYGPAGPLTITDPLNRITEITYSTTGLATSVTNPDGDTISFTYNSFGDLTSIVDPLQRTTTFAYDELGRLTATTDPGSRTTTVAYASTGEVTRVTWPDGSHDDVAYDGGGRPITKHDALGRVTRFGYDAFGRLKSVLDAAGGSTRYEYDAMSRIAAVIDAQGNAIRYDRDASGRLTQVTHPGGASEAFEFDKMDRLVAKTDRKGVVTRYDYDAAGRLTHVRFSDSTPGKDFTYDLADRLVSAGNATDILSWTYDAGGQIRSEASARNGTTVAYTYDNAGRRHSLSLDGTTLLTYGYDRASHLVSLASGSETFSFGYDDAGRRESMSHPNGVATQYTYDGLNRLTGMQAVLGGITPIVSSTYTYDPAGNRLTKGAADVNEAYTYDSLDRLTAVERSGTLVGHSHFGYDSVGNRTSTQIENAITRGTYNELNQVVSSDAGGALRVRGVLDEPGIVTVNGAPAQMLPGNVFEATIDATPGANSLVVQATDGSGNVRSSTFSVEVTAQPASHSYDANGNMITAARGPDTWRYEWDAENRLIRVRRNGSEQVRYSYDPLGRRVEIASTVPNTLATRMVYDGQDILRREGGTTSGRQITLYSHGPGIDEPLAGQETTFDFRGNPTPGLRRYFHADGLGSIVKVTAPDGTILESARYDAWGNLEASNLSQPFAFTGREWDGGTGLYYYRARYYDPRIGRFLSEDPIGFQGGPNFYGYVLNNPTRFRDPVGMVPPVVVVGVGVLANGAEGAAGGVGGQVLSNVLDNYYAGRPLTNDVWKDTGTASKSGALGGLISSLPLPGAGAAGTLVSVGICEYKAARDRGVENPFRDDQFITHTVIGGLIGGAIDAATAGANGPFIGGLKVAAGTIGASAANSYIDLWTSIGNQWRGR